MKKNNILLYLMLIGISTGGLCGWVFGKEMLVVDWIGEMFLDTLKMLVIPLIVSSMIVGITGLGDIRKVGKAGTITLVYFLSTSGIAVIAGIIVVNIMQPGLGVELTSDIPAKVAEKESIGITDILKSFVTPNLFQSMAKMEILPIIMFSLVFGGVLTTLGEKGKLVISVFDGINIAIMKIVHIVMYFAPLGVFALVSSKLGAAGGGDLFLLELLKIGKFAVTVILGLMIHALITLPAILYFVAKKNPLTYFKNMSSALTTALSTASSAATLPVTIECVEEENRISRRTTLFVIPLGATVNMNGTALYESIAAIFIAQMIGCPSWTRRSGFDFFNRHSCGYRGGWYS